MAPSALLQLRQLPSALLWKMVKSKPPDLMVGYCPELRAIVLCIHVYVLKHKQCWCMEDVTETWTCAWSIVLVQQ